MSFDITAGRPSSSSWAPAPEIVGEKTLWWMTVVAGALILLGSKLWLIAKYGSPTPFWDQWDAEAASLYDPYLSGHLHLSVLFSAHNEHRILMTRLLALGLLELGGQWDTLLQMSVNAVVSTGFMVMLLYLLRDLLPRTLGMILAIFSALILVIPFGWENTLAGFQNQFYFLLLFSCLALACSANAPVNTRRWWIGIALSIVAFFCMASGAIALPVAAALSILQFILGYRRGLRELIGIGAQLILAGVMVSAVPVLDGHGTLRAQSIGQGFDALRQSISWPLPGSDFGAVFVFSPIIALGIRIVRQPRTASAPIWLCLDLGGWVLAQHIALAYGRAVGADASRYLDLKTLGLIVNFAALIVLLQSLRLGRRQVIAIALLPTLWLGLVGIDLGRRALHQLPDAIVDKGQSGQTESQNLTRFLKTDDISALEGKNLMDVPYPDPVRLARLASLPTIRGILPPALVDDPNARAAVQQQLWTKGKLRSVARFLHRSGMTSGPYMVFIGFILFLIVGLLCCLTSRRASAT